MASDLRPRLFSTSSRTDPSPRRHNERLYQFLDRVDRRWYRGVRQTLEAWLEATPHTFGDRVAREFRSRRDRQCLAAFWELYLFTVLTRLGYSVGVDPPVAGTRRRADFLVESVDNPWMVEATVSFDEETDTAASRRQGQVYAALDQTDSPNFFLWIYVEQGVGPMPGLAPVRHELETWLAELDPDAIAIDVSAGRMQDHLPERTIAAGTWTLRFDAIPKSLDARGRPGIRPLGVFDTGGAKMLDTIGRLRKALVAKADQTRGADRPVLVALNAHGFFVDEDDVYASLFGDDAIQIRIGPDGVVGTEAVRQPTGFWTEGRLGRRPHVSGVLTVENLGPWNVHRVEPTLWLNPWAERPLELEAPFRRIEIDLSSGTRRETPARAPAAEILQLGADWPAAGDVWDD